MSNSSPIHSSALLLRSMVSSNFKASGDEKQLPDSEIVDIYDVRTKKETVFIGLWSPARARSF